MLLKCCTQFSSVTQSCLTLCDPMNHSTLGLPVHHQLLESTQTHVHWVDDAIQPSHPLSSPSPLAINFLSIRVFSNESALWIRWPKYWSFSFNISPYNEHPGLSSFRMDWLDLLAVQGTFKSLLQHHSSKASILLCSAMPANMENSAVTTGQEKVSFHSNPKEGQCHRIFILGKIESRRWRGWQRTRWFNDICDSMDMSLSKLREMVKDREAWHATGHGVTRSQTWLTNKNKASTGKVWSII